MNNPLHFGDSTKQNLILIFFMIISIIIINTKPVSNFIKYQISYKLMSAVKLRTMTRNMDVRRQGDISIYYHRGEDGRDISLIENSVEDAKSHGDGILGATRAYPLSIILFSSTDEFHSRFTNVYKDAAANYGFGTMCLSSDIINRYVIIHEFNHYIFDCFCKDKKIDDQNIPAWFQEGLAEYSAYSSMKVTFKAEPLKKLKSFKGLNTPEDITDAVADGYDVYTQSHMAVVKIISTNKGNVIQDILIQCRSMNFYQALKKTTSESIEDIERSITNSKYMTTPEKPIYHIEGSSPNSVEIEPDR